MRNLQASNVLIGMFNRQNRFAKYFIYIIGIAGSILILLFLSRIMSLTGDNLFKNFVLNPKPKSVKIVKYIYDGHHDFSILFIFMSDNSARNKIISHNKMAQSDEFERDQVLNLLSKCYKRDLPSKTNLSKMLVYDSFDERRVIDRFILFDPENQLSLFYVAQH